MLLPKFGWAREAPIMLGLFTVAATVEAFSARYALETASTPILGWLKVLLMGACALMMLLGFQRASLLSDDPREEVRKRALQARLCAFGFMAVSIAGAAGAFAYERQTREYAVYTASKAFAEDQKIAASFDHSDLEREEARQRMQPPAVAQRQFGDFLFPLLLHGLAAAAAGAMRAPVPLKRGEAEAIANAKAEAVQREKRNAAARERRKRAKKRKSSKAKRPAGVNVVDLRKEA